MQILNKLLSTLTLIGALIILTASWFFPISQLPAILGLIALCCALIMPRFSLVALMMALPVFGDRPGSLHLFNIILISSGINLGIFINNRLSKNQLAHNQTTSYAIYCALLYGSVSLLSLSSLPLDLVILELKSFIDYSSISNFLRSINFLILTNEHTLVYSVLSVFLTWQALLIMLAIYNYSVNSSKFSFYFATGVFLGLVHSLVIGLADYYQLIDLMNFRALDPVVNPDKIQFRLQSWFAHSGWFAEYVTLTIPFTILLLLLPLRFLWRALLIVILLLLGEFVLILTFQRGGWLSYPLTLVAVWGAIYVVYCIEQKKLNIASALRASLLKVLVSLPLTLLVSFSIIYFANVDKTKSVANYINRIKEIKYTHDRSNFIISAYLIGLEHPILGAASESYAYRFEQEFEDARGLHYQKFNLPLHGSSHNVYAQTFAGKGIIGLALLLATLASLLFNARFILLANELSIAQRLITLIGGTFAVAFLIYGNVQEIFYIQSLQLLVFAIIGLAAAQMPFDYSKVKNSIELRMQAIIFAALLLHLIWEYVLTDNIDRLRNYYQTIGCYGTEKNSINENFRWCRKRAFLRFETAELLPNRHFIEFKISIPAVYRKSVSIQVLSDYFISQQFEILPGEEKELKLELTKIPDDFSVPIEIIASRDFVPKAIWDNSNDLRPLSIQFALIETSS